MITIDSPSMVINDKRAAVKYQMDHSITAPPTATMSELAQAVVDRSNAINGRIENLILTAHGAPGFFQLGAGLHINSMSPFSQLQTKVFKIWFRGCLVGRIMDSQTGSQGDGAALRALGINSGNGHQFLSAFARLTGCYVVASTEMQGSRSSVYPAGSMDSYEGLVLSYDPQGSISWQRRYPSLHSYSADGRSAQAPNSE